MSGTLTLGCNTYCLTPASEPVKATYYCGDWYVSSKDCDGTINHLTVNSKQDPSQTVYFKSNVVGLTANVSTGANGDGRDNVIFEGMVTNSTITTGNSSSTAGDYVKFERSVILSTITTSAKNDSVVFCSSTTNGTTVNAGAGCDSIHFASSSKVGANTVINLGAGDNAADTIRVAAKSTFAGSGIVINNFEVGKDVILAPAGFWSTQIIRNQADANSYFGVGSVTLNS